MNGTPISAGRCINIVNAINNYDSIVKEAQEYANTCIWRSKIYTVDAYGMEE